MSANHTVSCWANFFISAALLSREYFVSRLLLLWYMRRGSDDNATLLYRIDGMLLPCLLFPPLNQSIRPTDLNIQIQLLSSVNSSMCYPTRALMISL
jgi:hypothetical protein